VLVQDEVDAVALVRAQRPSRPRSGGL